jgi:hypothetical protein
MFVTMETMQMKYKRNVNILERVAKFGYTKQKESNQKLLKKGNLLILTINKRSYRLLKYGKSILCFRDDGLRIETSLKGQRLYIGDHPVNLNDCSLRSAY